MRIYTTIFLFCCASYVSVAQSTDSLDNFQEFLVQLAWENHPTSDIFDRKLAIAEIETKAAKMGYWDAVLPFLSFSNGNLP
ncbi:MAG: hypothetical protein AAGI49_19605, partial [Bacteroidota bacterium]